MLRKGVREFTISGSVMEKKKSLKTNPAPKPPLLPHGGGVWSCGRGLKLSLCWDERSLSGKVSRHQDDRPLGGDAT